MSTYHIYVYEKGPLKGHREPGIYTDGQRKYIRLRERGLDSMIYVGDTIADAIKIRDGRKEASIGIKLGIRSEDEKAMRVTVAAVIDRYVRDGYPTRKGNPRREGRHRSAEIAYCRTLRQYFDQNAVAEDLVQDDLDQYHEWRVEAVRKDYITAARRRGEEAEDELLHKLGHRTTDLELNTLNSAIRWAVRKRLLRSNPLSARVRYYSPSEATHCREFAPTDIDELHEIAGVLMANPRSETLGWQLLFEAVTGLRCEEAVVLQMNARADQPGGLTSDGGSMCVRRANKSAKFNLYIQVNDGLRDILAAHRIWHAKRYPGASWKLPGRNGEGARPLGKSSLTTALNRLHRQRKLSKKYTSHGAGRAFYVLVRRSQRIPDNQIAYELNQTGGVATLEQVYGLAPDHWKNGKAPMLGWLPKVPAWTKIKGLQELTPCSTTPPSFEI